MASEYVYNSIRTLLTDEWSTTGIAWENERFERPEPPSPWVMCEISGTLYAQETIGAETQAANRWDEDGTLWMHVFVPVGTGSVIARRYAKQLADIFRGRSIDTIEFLEASIGMGEPGDEEGVYYRISVDISWRRWEA